jgi:predicted nucleic acid-binding protein
MNSTSLKLKFKERKLYFAENNAIRIHRAISWLESSNDVKDNDDLTFVSLWISFNACYAVQMSKDEILSEKENFRVFLKKIG